MVAGQIEGLQVWAAACEAAPIFFTVGWYHYLMLLLIDPDVSLDMGLVVYIPFSSSRTSLAHLPERSHTSSRGVIQTRYDRRSGEAGPLPLHSGQQKLQF